MLTWLITCYLVAGQPPQKIECNRGVILHGDAKTLECRVAHPPIHQGELLDRMLDVYGEPSGFYPTDKCKAEVVRK